MQELVHKNFDRRMEFYKLIKVCGNNFANNIVLSNEASLYFTGNVNL